VLPTLANGDTWTTALTDLGLEFTITPPNKGDDVRGEHGLLASTGLRSSQK
jgi:hypothetical protein